MPAEKAKAEALVAAQAITIDGVEYEPGQPLTDAPAGNVAAMKRLGQAVAASEWAARVKAAADTARQAAATAAAAAK